MPTMAPEQFRRGVEQERQKHALGLGEVESMLEGAPGGARVAEGVAGGRFLQPRRHHPRPADAGDRAVKDRREDVGRRPRLALGQPQ